MKLENLKLQKEINALGQNSPSALFSGNLAASGLPLSSTGGKDWVNQNLGVEKGFALEAQPTPGRATLVPHPDSFTGQTAQENLISRMLLLMWGLSPTLLLLTFFPNLEKL